MKTEKVPVKCPHCGHVGLEPPEAYSTVCKRCHQHFRVQEVLHPAARPAEAARPQRRITCFICGGSLDVAASAQSTMCRHCGNYVDLKDYRIANAVPKNYRTKGRLVIEESGFLFNTDTIAGEVLLKGRFLGKLTAERSLEIHNGAELKGTFRTGHLIIPPGTVFRWAEPLKIGGATVGGEFIASLVSEGTVFLKSTARFFGDLSAAALVVESGAVVVGQARVGTSQAEPGPAVGESAPPGRGNARR